MVFQTRLRKPWLQLRMVCREEIKRASWPGSLSHFSSSDVRPPTSDLRNSGALHCGPFDYAGTGGGACGGGATGDSSSS